MSKAIINYRPVPDILPKRSREGNALEVFLREHWWRLVISAVIGNLIAEPLAEAYLMPHVGSDLLGILIKALIWIPPAAILFTLTLLFDWLFERLSENNYKTLLVGRYLRRRRIAWISLLAVTLCTTMVLVVISVMGGWLNMFKSSFRGLSGDIVIHSDGMAGFPYYQTIIDQLKKDHPNEIESAVPSIETYGLLNFGRIATLPVKVMGISIATVGTVNRFPESLYRQHGKIVEALKDKTLSAIERAALERQLAQIPSFDLLDVVTVPAASLPAGLEYQKPVQDQDIPTGSIKLPDNAPDELRNKLQYDAIRHNLSFAGPMKPEWKELLAGLSVDPNYQAAIDALFHQSQNSRLVDYSQLSRGRGYGMIAGTGVIGIRRNHEGEWEGREPWKYNTPVGLTVLDVSGGNVTVHDRVTRTYFIVDDSRTQVWQYDNNYVYVSLERLQKDLGLDAQKGTDSDGRPVEIPARATDIHIKVKAGIDPNDEVRLSKIAEGVRETVHEVMRDQQNANGGMIVLAPDPRTQTWQDTQRIWINAIENEKLMLVVLFGIISVVAIFLIFCIFFMIVVEKTKDIGIAKSVGGTSVGVSGIFLGYGLIIGLTGSFLGLALSYLIVHNINELHNMLGRLAGIQIWNPEVYLFDKIPNTMSGVDVAVILPIAVLSSVLGALVPAIRAGRLNPVEALRWE